jgi:N-acetylmuramoyl-L-alanine amidase
MWLWILLAATPLPVVAIDPGHGGAQQGARGVCGIHEKDVTLSIGKELALVLEASGRADAVLSRTNDEDVALEERAARAHRAGATLLVSIHANAGPSPSSHGVETFFVSHRAADRRHHDLVLRENDGRPADRGPTDGTLGLILHSLQRSVILGESQQLAIRLHETLHERLSSRARGVMQAPFIVLRDAKMAAVLVEVGFLTNADECAKLAALDYQRGVAGALAAGVLAHLGSLQTALARH